MDLKIDQFIKFAKIAAQQGGSGEDSTISVTSKGELRAGKWVSLGSRTTEFKMQNQNVRQELLKALCNEFSNNIPQSVLDVMKMGDFSIGKDGEVKSQRPLTARRILAITQAVEAERKRAIEEAIKPNLARPDDIKNEEQLNRFMNRVGITRGQFVDLMKKMVYDNLPDNCVGMVSTFSSIYSHTMACMKLRMDMLDKLADPNADVKDLLRDEFKTILPQMVRGRFAGNSNVFDARDHYRASLRVQLAVLEDTLNVDDVYEAMKNTDVKDPEQLLARYDEAEINLFSQLTNEAQQSAYSLKRFSGFSSSGALKTICHDTTQPLIITREDIIGTSPIAQGSTLATWITNGPGGENSTILDGSGVGSLANDIFRGREGSYSFSVNSQNIDISEFPKDSLNKMSCLNAAKKVAREVKKQLGENTPEAQLAVIVQSLSQNGLELCKMIQFPNMEHASGHFNVTKEQSGDVKLTFTANPITYNGQMHNYAHEYVIHADGSSELVSFNMKQEPVKDEA